MPFVGYMMIWSVCLKFTEIADTVQYKRLQTVRFCRVKLTFHSRPNHRTANYNYWDIRIKSQKPSFIC